jgi:NaMN:DMB phosphoribosyltransferase
MKAVEFRDYHQIVRDRIASVPSLAPEWRVRAGSRLNSLTKPLGSLGRLEEIATRLVAIREEERPQCSNKVIFTLAADHGITEEGVSAYPKAVTRQMVLNSLVEGRRSTSSPAIVGLRWLLWISGSTVKSAKSQAW